MPINTGRIIRRFMQLIAIDAPSYHERAMADELTRQLLTLGASVWEDEVGAVLGGSAGNLVARIPGSVDAIPLLFSSHMDTVEPALGKQAILQEDGRITSAGNTVLGADDAAGLTAILEALTVLQEDRIPHRPLELLFPVAEEPYCQGSRLLDFSQFQSKEAYVLDLDGPIGHAALRAPTILYFRATFHGRAAHAGMAPEAGIHAICAAANAVEKLPMGAVDDYTTLNVGRIQGGLATNIVPDTCTVEGEIRGFQHSLVLHWMEQVQRQFSQSSQRYGATLEMQTENRITAYEIDETSPVVERFRRACRIAELTSTFGKTFGGSDNNNLALHGIQGIVLSSAMHNPHTTEEYTTVAELTALSQLALALMTDLK